MWGPGRKAQEGEEGQEPLCQTGRAWGAEQAEKRTGRQEALHPLPAGVVGPPCSQQQDMTPGGLGTGSPGCGSGGALPDGQVRTEGGQAGLPGMSSEHGWISGLQPAASARYDRVGGARWVLASPRCSRSRGNSHWLAS